MKLINLNICFVVLLLSLIPTLLGAQQNQSSPYSIVDGDTLDLKQFYLDEADDKSKKAKTYGWISAGSFVGAFLVVGIVTGIGHEGPYVVGLIPSAILLYGPFPIFGFAAIHYSKQSKHLKKKAAALTFYYDGGNSDLGLSKEKITLIFGPTNNGIGITLTF